MSMHQTVHLQRPVVIETLILIFNQPWRKWLFLRSTFCFQCRCKNISAWRGKESTWIIFVLNRLKKIAYNHSKIQWKIQNSHILLTLYTHSLLTVNILHHSGTFFIINKPTLRWTIRDTQDFLHLHEFETKHQVCDYGEKSVAWEGKGGKQ
jgi:hypothetical protein